jgi:ketosteroid isomerase-like protein
MTEQLDISTPSNTQTPAPPTRDAKQVQDFLDRFANALIAGDGKAVAALWAVPAMVLGDDMVRPVNSAEEIEKFFGDAKEQYNSRGIVGTRADILRLEWVSDKIVLVDVRWPYIDQGGNELAEESSTYTLMRDVDGNFKLRVALMRGVSEPH